MAQTPTNSYDRMINNLGKTFIEQRQYYIFYALHVVGVSLGSLTAQFYLMQGR